LSNSTERAFDGRITQARQALQAAQRHLDQKEKAAADAAAFWGEFGLVTHSLRADVKKARASVDAAQRILDGEIAEKEKYRTGG